MHLINIKNRLEQQSILFSNESLLGRPTIIGYDKKFKLQWFATQLNTFIIAMDLGAETVSVPAFEAVLNESWGYAKFHHNGLPRGFQSASAVITILISSHVDQHAIDYCRELRAGKKWAGCSVPVAIDTTHNHLHYFTKTPFWGAIYFPYIKNLIIKTTQP